MVTDTLVLALETNTHALARSASVDAVRAEVMRLEGERVWIQEDWLGMLSVLALYNAEARWYDAVRRMNTARHNAVAWIIR